MSTLDSVTLPVPTQGVYRIDPERSVVRVSTRAMFGLLPVRGTVRVGGGVLRVVTPTENSSVEAVIRADTFDTANQERDEHVRSADFLNTTAYPEFVFTGDRWSIARGRPVLHGQLTVRGITGPVDVTLKSLSQRGGELTAQATARVDRYAFGITRSRGLAGRHLRIDIEVVAAT
ncbi:YceI family protein [Micromonospora sp. KC723]|uniref:YceI family protein n=1 Tax=Micromonospora sp. KC723 TaxID=2530381 RepID=UPI001049A5D1|nr:YceI family protein [Micromonospora sp. KC723]TDB78129.1 YceI family protein [Micromonospora sp. KC723]